MEELSFTNLSPDELSYASSIVEILDWLGDFFSSNEDDDTNRTHCMRCMQSAHLPPPSDLTAKVKAISLQNAFNVRILHETLLNESLRSLTKEVNDWCASQRLALIHFISNTIILPDSDTDLLARDAGRLDPDLQN